MLRLESLLSSLEGRTRQMTRHSYRLIPLFLYFPITSRKRYFREMVIGREMQERYVFQHSRSRAFTWACQLFLSSRKHWRRFGIRAARILSSTPTHTRDSAGAQTPNIPSTLQEPPFQN
jgi:hypothetical protein